MRIYTKNTYHDMIDSNFIYQNYHKHSMYTNPIIIDSCTYPEEYAMRAKQLGHTILSSCEHGYQGRYIEYYELAKTCMNYDKNNPQCKDCSRAIGSCERSSKPLKFLFAVEAYFVWDRFEKDNTNAHLVIAAKNEKGRKAINRILSEANMTGYYYRARIDWDLLMMLPEDDVWITTACIGGINRYTKDNVKSEKLYSLWKEHSDIYSSPYELLVDKLHQKFGDNLYLEVQCHNTDIQKQVNSMMIELSKKYNIEIIAGVDSHFIYEADAWKRDYLQKSSGIFLEDEQGWLMDYPDGQTLFNRFQNQGILQDDEILVAMSNTNVFLDVQEYDSPIFNYEMKMPTALKYKNYTKKEKELELMRIVKQQWDKVKNTIPQEEHQHYLREIAKELDIIFKINHADYFLANYEIIKDAVENRGGMITFSGRGCLTGDALVFGIYNGIYSNKKLQDIKVGDKVQGKDGYYHLVLNTMKYNIHENGIELYINDTVTTMTSDHKVLTLIDDNEVWVQAQDLTQDNVVLYYSEDRIRTEYNIQKIRHTIIDTYVYDLTVEDCHSYVANGFIVHNSGPSFIVNHLLGFTQIDRVSSPITLYPERFLSTSRMSAGSLADIDFNCGNTPVFEEAQKHIMGEEHAYPMIAYGTQKPKAAWKMFCRAVDVPFEVANEISSKIDEYETDLKYWDEDSGEDKPEIYDYIPEDLRTYFDQSKEFLGIISSASRHPCFIGETLVNTENGYKQIKDITVGEKVLSHDGKYHKVLKVMKRDITEDLLKFVTYENNSFIVTKNHPILTDVSAIYDFETKRDFMPAMLFKTGDKLFSPDNHIYCIKDIQKIKIDNIIQVYNLNVDITNTYTVTTDDIIVHNCGNILYSDDIREEFGIVRLKSKGGKETIVACCDGKWIEKHLMLKNDLLTVACVKLNYLLYKRVGIPYMSLNKLLDECKEHPEVWQMYEKGYVIGLNQVEKPSTKRKVMKYKPKNISELSAFIAGIRPAFKSLLDKLINREHFEYGIPTLDKLLQTEELPESFILYQEQIMKILAFAGIPMGDCYTVIKSISKKRFAKIMHYKEQFLTGMAQKLIEEENVSKERAEEVATTIWGIIEDASAYGFNSSHSLSVSFDSLLAAYFKALYPLEFYEVYLNLQMERADKAKALLATKEMKEAFNIKLLPMRFGQDNRQYTAYKEQNALSNCLKSIKGFGNIVGVELFRLAQHKYNNFLDLLVAREDYVKLYPIEVWDDYTSTHIVDDNIDKAIRMCLDIYIKQKDNEEFLIDKKRLNLENVFSLSDIENLYSTFELSKPLWKIKVNDTQIETLIMLNYFAEFGNNNKLLEEFKLFCNYYGRTQINKDKLDELHLNKDVFLKYVGKETKSLYKNIDFVSYIKEISESIPDKYVALPKQLKFERELLEIPIYQNEELPKTWYYVLGFKTYGDRINTPYLILYNLNDASIVNCQINNSKRFREEPFGIYSIIDVRKMEDVPKKKKIGEKQYVITNEMKTVVKEYEVMIRDKNAEINEVINDG